MLSRVFNASQLPSFRGPFIYFVHAVVDGERKCLFADVYQGSKEVVLTGANFSIKKNIKAKFHNNFTVTVYWRFKDGSQLRLFWFQQIQMEKPEKYNLYPPGIQKLK